MKTQVNWKALGGLLAFLLLVAVATADLRTTALLVIGATVIIELLTFFGAFGWGRPSPPTRKRD